MRIYGIEIMSAVGAEFRGVKSAPGLSNDAFSIGKQAGSVRNDAPRMEIMHLA